MLHFQENLNQLETMRRNFKLLREEKGWSFEGLSKLSKISVEEIIGIEEGRDFDVTYLFILCRIYNIKIYKTFEELYIMG